MYPMVRCEGVVALTYGLRAAIISWTPFIFVALATRAAKEGEKIKRQEPSKNTNQIISQTIQHNVTRTLSCTAPKRHFMFSKIEKTGSSTLYGIFQRYVKTNKLNLMVQTVGYHLMTSQPKGAHPGEWIYSLYSIVAHVSGSTCFHPLGS